MKKRIYAFAILALILLPILCLPALADAHWNESDITQNTSGAKPSGFEYPFHYFDYEKGVTGDEISKLDAVYLLHVAVFSDYAEEGLDKIAHDSIMYPTYKKNLAVGGIPDNAPYNDPNYLGEQLFRGVTLFRDKENELKKFEGGFFFTNDDEYVGWTDDVELYKIWYRVRYGYWAYVSFSISNVVFDKNGISMDIDGEQSYRYEVVSSMHDSYPAGNDVPETEVAKFKEFKAKTDRTESVDNTRRTISVKGAKAQFVLYDLENSDDKNLLLKVEGGGITLLFNVLGVIGNKTASPLSPGVTQNASDTPGEDGGVSVPAAIVIGVVGGGAAIAGAAAASGDGASDDEKKKSYKMYVQKDFGDAIRRGGDKPVKIRARMAEVDPYGAERDRDDLTGNIGVSVEGMTLHGTALVGRYLEATVSVPEDNYDDTARIIFTYFGEGGTFTNTVIFRLVDGPTLKFIEETENAGEVKLNYNGCGIDAIPGDGFTYTEKFMIVDAPVAPKLSDITAVNTGEFDVEFELTDHVAVYKMSVKNNTKPDPEHDIFAKVTYKDFEIHVVVEGEKEPVKGYVSMNMYPEGITISSTQEGKKNDVKYVRVQAYEKEYVGDLDKKWQVSEIKFTLAAPGKDKAIIDPEEAKYKFEKLKGSGGLGMRADKEQTLAEKYEYKESWGDWNGKFTYDFEPNSNLPEPEDGTFFMVILPTKCEYDGKTYEAEIPLRLRGKDPDPMGDWEKEYKALQQRILKYSIPENIDKWIAQLKECATEPRASVEEMRLVGKWILREYMQYWTTQQSRDQSEATMYNVIVNVLEWTKFAGDCAFSFLINAYAGPVADAILSPAKDFATGAIGEVLAARNFGEEVNVDNFEFSKNLAAAGDNLVSSAIDLTNWKKAAATLGGYFVYCAIKNYLLKLREKNESDIWGSLCDAFKDMTAAALKSKAGDLIGKWLKESKKFQEKIGPFITKYFKETNFDTLQKKLNDSLGLEGELRKLAGYANDKVFETKVAEVVGQYISGLVGAGFDKVREVYDGSKFVIENGCVYYCFNIDLFDAFHYGIKLNLTRTLQAMSGDFFGWFYDFFFAGVPAAESVIEKPKDPPLLTAKN